MKKQNHWNKPITNFFPRRKPFMFSDTEGNSELFVDGVGPTVAPVDLKCLIQTIAPVTFVFTKRRHDGRNTFAFVFMETSEGACLIQKRLNGVFFRSGRLRVRPLFPLCVVKDRFDHQNYLQINVKEGEYVQAIESDPRGWTLVRNSSGRKGRVPTSLLEKIDFKRTTPSNSLNFFTTFNTTGRSAKIIPPCPASSDISSVSPSAHPLPFPIQLIILRSPIFSTPPSTLASFPSSSPPLPFPTAASLPPFRLISVLPVPGLTLNPPPSPSDLEIACEQVLSH
jgi:hypothetical protein